MSLDCLGYLVGWLGSHFHFRELLSFGFLFCELSSFRLACGRQRFSFLLPSFFDCGEREKVKFWALHSFRESDRCLEIWIDSVEIAWYDTIMCHSCAYYQLTKFCGRLGYLAAMWWAMFLLSILGLTAEGASFNSSRAVKVIEIQIFLTHLCIVRVNPCYLILFNRIHRLLNRIYV